MQQPEVTKLKPKLENVRHQLYANNDSENKNKISERTDGDKRISESSLKELTVDQALNLAFFYYEKGHLTEIEKLCRLILQKFPNQPDAMYLLAVVFAQNRKYKEAVKLLREAARQAPGHAHIHNSLGMALCQMGNIQEAALEFNRAVQIQPEMATAYNNLGIVLIKMNRMDDAVTACRKAIHLDNNFKEAYNNLGTALKKKGELANAAGSYQKALSIDAEYAGALSNLGMVLVAQGRFGEASKNLQKAVRLVPDSAEFQGNLGILFNRQGYFEKAIEACKKAISIRPSFVEAHNNLGTALMELGRYNEAIAAFEKAISIDYECAQSHHNLALVLLLNAEFKQGWYEYEWRWRNADFSTPLRPFSHLWWNGSTEKKTKLLVWGEQGIGDEVQFSGLIGHLLVKGVEVVIECDRRLIPLFRRNFPGVIVVERTDPPAALLENLSITHQVPIASLPYALGLSPKSMNAQNPFLVPDEKRRDQFRKEYKADGAALLVGISFRSGNTQEGAKRSIGMENWESILNIEGVRFVNLQYGECSRQLQLAYERFGVEILKDERINPLNDLDSFAAQVAAMDLVISVDNSTVHFAGALGIETWTMLPVVPDWRWGLEGERTHWYPTMRLFRQREIGDWGPVISRIAKELTLLINSSKINKSISI